MPHTASPAASAVTTPLRASEPNRTSAMSLTRTITPLRVATTVLRMSSRVWMRPSERTSSASSPLRMRPAPSLRLLTSTAFSSICVVMPRAAMAEADGITSKVRTWPPSTLTSATPGRPRSAGRIVQSSSDRFSCVDRVGDSMVNITISASGVTIGARPPSLPAGSWSRTSCRRSLTWARAQKMSVPSANSKVSSATAYRVVERMRTRFGMPRAASSIGVVTRLSSSSGVRPGACIDTSTWTGATSGKASIESFW